MVEGEIRVPRASGEDMDGAAAGGLSADLANGLRHVCEPVSDAVHRQFAASGRALSRVAIVHRVSDGGNGSTASADGGADRRRSTTA